MHHRNQITIQTTVHVICHPRVCHQTEEANQLAMNLKQNEAQSARAELKHKGVNWRSKYVHKYNNKRPQPPTCLHACQVRVTVADSDLCCCTCVTYFERQLTPLCVDYEQCKLI